MEKKLRVVGIKFFLCFFSHWSNYDNFFYALIHRITDNKRHTMCLRHSLLIILKW